AKWIRATLMRKPAYRLLLPEVDDLQELRIMLAERMEEWAHEHEAKGEALALQKLLTKRFGAIPSDILAMIAAATRAQIEVWFDSAIDAGSYEAVFGSTRDEG
ncbi:MAG: hypothetical protein R8K48_05430, partial [Gallionella sp.]